MSLGVSKECFPTPDECHNCERKKSKYVKKKTEPKEGFKRCGNCHMMTYCDKDCQREHWLKVHKKHCRILSGKVFVKNSEHNAATCKRCIEQSQESTGQLKSLNSPKTICNIEQVAVAMKQALSSAFQFHGEGKKCDCSLQYAFELPFPLGEVSGQYMEFGSTGLDVMMAHALDMLINILNKTLVNQNEDHKNALLKLWKDIIQERSFLWCEILVCGVPAFRSMKYLCDQVDKIQAIYGASNAWWKVLKFSVDFFVNTRGYILSNSNDSRSLEGARFQHAKQFHDYHQSQLKNEAIVCDKQIWHNFMFWPEIVNGSLAMILPPGTRCQICFTELSGEVTISPEEFNSETLPILLPYVGNNGALMASCSHIKSPNCYNECLFKNVIHQVQTDKDKKKEIEKESEIFKIESGDCDFCMKWNLSSHRCSACLAVQYCSTVCQSKDLEFHKTVCSTWAKDKSRRILGKEKQRNYWKSN